MSGSGYNEKYFENFATLLSDGSQLFNARLYIGSDAVSLTNPIAVTSPSDSYTMTYTGDLLTTITRTSDSKVITLTYTGDNVTTISDWT